MKGGGPEYSAANARFTVFFFHGPFGSAVVTIYEPFSKNLNVPKRFLVYTYGLKRTDIFDETGVWGGGEIDITLVLKNL